MAFCALELAFMNGTELIVRHSFAPNRLRYCGANDLSVLIPEFIEQNKKSELEKNSLINSANNLSVLEEKLQTELLSFRGLFSYLSLIARENGLSPFDEKVGEAYWIGNELLENVSVDALKSLFLEKFSTEDFLGPELAANLAFKIPSDAIAHHSFHVFFTHFMTKAVPVTMPNMEKCRISFGKVVELDLESASKTVLVEFEPVEFDSQGNSFFFGEKAVKTIENPFSDDVQINDWVSFHWNTYCMALSKKQKEALEFFTKKNIAKINSAVLD